MKAEKQHLNFQAEVKQVLRLVINSLYSNKEIFLRELISNASDACDKLKFEAISNEALFENDNDLKIQVRFDEKQRTITVSDNGIGMTHDEVIQNIGTIARSGTREFLNSLTGDKQKDLSLIGQFGVGFYSSFIVADRVTLSTRKAGTPQDQGVLWESAGEGEFTIQSIEKKTRGTDVVLHLKETEGEFLHEFRLSEIIRKFSDHISLPVVMEVQDEGNGKKKGDHERKNETINKASALWTRPKIQIKDEEYREFYKNVSHDFEDPLTWIHARLEGKLDYSLLLYVPKNAPYDLWWKEKPTGVKLYVKRVFIMDDADKLLPRYLRFIRGVVDSNDLPLNVSREILQDNQIITTIRGTIVTKVLDLLKDLSQNDKEKFKQFWKEFGRVIKEGVVEDFAHRNEIAALCRFASTFDDKEEQAVSLEDYIFRMKPGQKEIFYLTAESFAAAKNNPLLEGFRKKGIEVLLLSDPVDHWFVTHLNEFKEKKFQAVNKGEVDLSKIGEEGPSETPVDKKASEDLIERLKKSLSEFVTDVRVSTRLTQSPSCLVYSQQDLDPSLKKLFAQTGQKMPENKPVLEINPSHALLKRINTEKDTARLSDWSRLLFDEAILSEGQELDDPVAFVKRVNELLIQN